MCLTSRKSDVVRFLNENKDKEFIKVYKRVNVYAKIGELHCSLHAPHQTFTYAAGEHDFSDEIKHNNRMRNNVGVFEGFHCWLDADTARRSGYGVKTVPFYVKPEDLLGLCKNHAVFKRAILLQKDHDKAIGVKK